jgi:hypothetical protein
VHHRFNQGRRLLVVSCRNAADRADGLRGAMIALFAAVLLAVAFKSAPE